MLALPIANRLESVARYYQALCTWRRGDVDNARQSLERVVEEASPHYRTRALQIIGLTYHERGEIDAALRFYLAAAKGAAENDLPALIESQRITAVVRSIHGDHKRALADLESLFPSVRAISKHSPVLYYEFLNSLAVELGEVGRLAEAGAALSIALASPFASVYSEWSETRDEIAAKRTSATPSVVAITHAPHVNPAPQPQSQPKPLKLIAFSFPESIQVSFQISVFPIPATATFASRAISILDRVLICAGPRAPPNQI